MTKRRHSSVFTPGLLVVVVALALAALNAAVVSTDPAPAGQPELGILRPVAQVLGGSRAGLATDPRAALD